MYDIDLYTYGGTILQHECLSLDEVFALIKDSIDSVQLVNITKS